jgi:DNA-binding HxlR family transcriptional regulator
MKNTTIEEYQSLARDENVVFDEKNCPMTASMKVIGGKWKLIILNLITLNSPVRFTTLKKKIKGITQSMLSLSLRELETDGIIERKVYAEVPPRVEYTLTERGRSLAPILRSMCDWGFRNMLEQK